MKIDQDNLEQSAHIARALAHKLRLRIVDYIDKNPVTQVNHIYKELGCEQSNCSSQLRILRLAGIVTNERKGKYIYYRLDYSILERVQTALNNFKTNEIF